MRFLIVCSGAIALMAATGVCLPSAVVGQEAEAYLLKSAKLVFAQTHKLPSGQDHVFLAGDGKEKRKDVRVVLTQTEYECAFLRNDGTNVNRGAICYQIRSLDPDVAFSWSFWTSYAVTGFRWRQVSSPSSD